MTNDERFKLVPRGVPLRQRSSFYREMISEFLAAGEPSVQIVGTDRKPGTLVQGLRKALRSEGIEEVKVLRRGENVYLVRT